MLGIAKLLLPVVHVKRETLQVVSLAMTGLMRDWGWVFHTRAVPGTQFSVLSSQFSVLSSQFDHRPTMGCLDTSKDWRLIRLRSSRTPNLELCFHHMRPSLEEVTRTGWGVLRCVRAVLSRVTLPKALSRKLVWIFSILSGSIGRPKRKLTGSSSFDR